MTFLEVRFYIDFEVSLVGKRFKGFRDCAIIIRRGSWKWAWRRVILRGAPADLHSRVLSLYCSVTFFDGCVGRITSKLRGEAKPTILEQSDCASSHDFSYQSLNWSFEWFASLRHWFRLVESWPDRTISERELIVSLSSTSFSVMFSSCLSCNRTGEVFSYAAIQTMFVFAAVHLALPFGWKCL